MALLRGQPPAQQPWARFQMKRVDRPEGSVQVEFKTDWDEDESVRLDRRGFFNCMVQAIKQLPPGEAAFQGPPLRCWVIKSLTAGQELLEQMQLLGFCFAPQEAQRFFEVPGAPRSVVRTASTSSTPSREAKRQRVDSETCSHSLPIPWNTGPLTSETLLGNAPAVSSRAVPLQRADRGLSTPVEPTRGLLKPGVEVVIQGVVNPAQSWLNGQRATVQAKDPTSDRWVVVHRTTQYALAPEKLQLFAAPPPASVPAVVVIEDSVEGADEEENAALEAAAVALEESIARSQDAAGRGGAASVPRQLTAAASDPATTPLSEPTRDSSPVSSGAATAGAPASNETPPRRYRLRRRSGAAQEGSPAVSSTASRTADRGASATCVGGPPASQPAAASASGAGSEQECAICMDGVVDHVFVPCGHMTACGECAPKLKKKPCPVCRMKVKQVVKVFRS